MGFSATEILTRFSDQVDRAACRVRGCALQLRKGFLKNEARKEEIGLLLVVPQFPELREEVDLTRVVQRNNVRNKALPFGLDCG